MKNKYRLHIQSNDLQPIDNSHYRLHSLQKSMLYADYDIPLLQYWALYLERMVD